MIKIYEKYDLIYLTYDLSDNIKMGFSTKHGGVSSGQYSSMNLSYNRGDDINNVEQNYKRFKEALELGDKNTYLNHQVHCDRIRVIKQGDAIGYDKDLQYDAFITDQSGAALAVIHADCVPVLFFKEENEKSRAVIGAAHSGWKGTLLGIASKTAQAMKNEFKVNMNELKAVIGPCICKDCFFIRDDVFSQFEEHLPWSLKYCTKLEGGQYKMDMKAIIKEELERSGLLKENIMTEGVCTSCNGGLFHSHRRDKGTSGAMAGIICITEN